MTETIRLSRAVPAALLALALVAVTLFAMPGVAQAAKRSKASVSVADATYGSTAMAYVGSADATAKTSSLTADTSSDGMLVKAECFQNGEVVYREYSTVSNGTAPLTLGPTPRWTSGSADCVAELGSFGKNMRWRATASDSFFVKG